MTNVRIQNPSVNDYRTESTQCSDSARLAIIKSVEYMAQDVVRRFLYELMRSRFPTKTALAAGIGSSRSQLQASIRQGYLTVKQMNSLAEAMGSSVWGVMKELSTLAEGMEKGRLAKLTEGEMTELLEGRERKSRGRMVLQGELDEITFSGETDETPDEDQDSEPSEPSEQPTPHKPHASQGQRRQR